MVPRLTASSGTTESSKTELSNQEDRVQRVHLCFQISVGETTTLNMEAKSVKSVLQTTKFK